MVYNRNGIMLDRFNTLLNQFNISQSMIKNSNKIYGLGVLNNSSIACNDYMYLLGAIIAIHLLFTVEFCSRLVEVAVVLKGNGVYRTIRNGMAWLKP